MGSGERAEDKLSLSLLPSLLTNDRCVFLPPLLLSFPRSEEGGGGRGKKVAAHGTKLANKRSCGKKYIVPCDTLLYFFFMRWQINSKFFKKNYFFWANSLSCRFWAPGGKRGGGETEAESAEKPILPKSSFFPLSTHPLLYYSTVYNTGRKESALRKEERRIRGKRKGSALVPS